MRWKHPKQLQRLPEHIGAAIQLPHVIHAYPAFREMMKGFTKPFQGQAMCIVYPKKAPWHYKGKDLGDKDRYNFQDISTAFEEAGCDVTIASLLECRDFDRSEVSTGSGAVRAFLNRQFFVPSPALSQVFKTHAQGGAQPQCIVYDNFIDHGTTIIEMVSSLRENGAQVQAFLAHASQPVCI